MTTRPYTRIPDDLREQIIPELGTMPDQALAEKFSTPKLPIDRHLIFDMRKARGIEAFAPKDSYDPPAFRGRLEDAHPEVAALVGRVPVGKIADYFGVHRGTVRAAAKRLGRSTRVGDAAEVIGGLLLAGKTVYVLWDEHDPADIDGEELFNGLFASIEGAKAAAEKEIVRGGVCDVDELEWTEEPYDDRKDRFVCATRYFNSRWWMRIEKWEIEP